MTKEYYECHITMISSKEDNCEKCSNRDLVKTWVEYAGWKYSSIDGDPTLGAGIKCYATHHYNKKYTVKDVKKMMDNAVNLIKYSGAKILRKKIELVIYDERIK